MDTDAPQQRGAIAASCHDVSIRYDGPLLSDGSNYPARTQLQRRHFGTEAKFNAFLPGVIRKGHTKSIRIARLVAFIINRPGQPLCNWGQPGFEFDRFPPREHADAHTLT